eukprot:TRINITY_DN3631_c0_g1_i2.p2 TRINITY_DN3631_c0_g1~~TRINITY_DN3631_c0_g1_i2.p2  ORF type:complete len:381 (-),score=39.11 TRINITY_DN3631_c0_g1_i2:2352-3494(-)
MHLQTNDEICHKLEFYLHVYFAIFPMHSLNPRSGDINKLKRELDEFKLYLDSEKSKFAQIPELLPFYALLFVPNPHVHPSFKHLFSKQWAIELRNKLNAFLTHFLPPMGPPLLYEVYRMYRENQKKGGSLPQIIELQRESSDAHQWLEEIEELKKREEYTRKTLIESQGKWTGFSKGILAVCKSLMEVCSNKKPIDVAKQKTVAVAADKIKKYEKVLETNEKDLHEIEQEYQKALAIDNQRLQNSFLSVSQQREDSGTSSPLALKSQDRSIIEYSLPDLNYAKIREALKEYKDPLKLCAILQALRWRITRTSHGPPRKSILQSFVENDLLGCAMPGGSIIGGLVTSINKKYNCRVQQKCRVVEYAVCLINVLASEGHKPL